MSWRAGYVGAVSSGVVWSAAAPKSPKVVVRKSPGWHPLVAGCGFPQSRCGRELSAALTFQPSPFLQLIGRHRMAFGPARALGTQAAGQDGGDAREEEVATEEEAVTAKQARIKVSIAKSTGRLDLSECGLTSVPPEVFDVSDLRDLSLAGNRIWELPREIGQLTCLERLVLAGNLLKVVPDEIGKLMQLEGLWIHGNLLEMLPDSISNLTRLAKCSLAGNRLAALPPGFGLLRSLQQLDVSGNQLVSLPDSLCSLQDLRVLSLHGNQLRDLPKSFGDLLGLEELSLQGNCLTTVADLPRNLRNLSLADNLLTCFGSHPGRLENLMELKSVSLYGNQLQDVPPGLLALPKLKSIWLEGNPLAEDAMDQISSPSQWGPSLKSVGLDQNQFPVLKAQAWQQSGTVLKFSKCSQSTYGYFKLASVDGHNGAARQPSSNGVSTASMLVVAFGSAPGVPNWGGLLKRVQSKIAASEEDLRSVTFDTLFVVDPKRSWYGASESDDGMLNHYRRNLQAVTSRYDHVVMIGDSMGASGALLFASLATSVLAFCPQVDLSSSSIRPASGQEGWARFKDRVLEGVGQSSASVTVLSGSWEHDMEQVRQLPQEQINWKVFHVDTHRLAIHLENAGRLVPLVLGALAEEVKVPSGTTRAANML
ncbi:unnamed protein product [Ostreobium quekettii]|uniref:Disease resistance R13L4/SHOC-2-like LRR domain-containing protein n=1 Tax=Ostreobium quekettii TaxID=121088 RepID=A0A8S1IRK7_9CHLO|nr:unnamed protein product [Ostreobium quekettii]|eukprot:evm.model.scf_139.5 EVM.evm.TU.scf_139.5   scf_139:47967-49919(-)